MSATRGKHYGGSYLMPAFEHATVADAMHPGILSCEPEETLTDVARLMATHHVHCLAVMGVAHDQAGESLVWGILSDMDLLEAGAHGRGEQTAQTAARQPVFSVEPTMALRDAVELMLLHAAPHVLVVDPGRQRPVGILSSLDVAGVLAWGEG